MTATIDRQIIQDLLAEDLGHYTEQRLKLAVPDFIGLTDFKVRYQLSSLNRKRNSGEIPLVLKENAKSKFLEIQDELSSLDVCSFSRIESVRHIVYNWLPPLEHVINDVFAGCGFGPGAVFQTKKYYERSHIFKIGGIQTISYTARELLPYVFQSFPNWVGKMGDVRVQSVVGNRLAWVPKDVSKCRQIAVEPSLNVFIQKGIGNYLIQLLKRKGIADLETGQTTHRRLVREEWDSIGTIDLSDASDRISVACVKAILPPDWFALLNAARSHFYKDGSKWQRYQSFSSQGNAFTFPLETLIFKAVALAHSLHPERVSVYGDDIISDRGDAEAISLALATYGFKVNTEKSFWGQHAGPMKFFRESCGEDTYFGHSVRPVFYKDDAAGDEAIFSLANMLYEKWGKLPQVHTYLGQLVGKPIFGPRTYVSSDVRDPSKNSLSTSYSGYFWEEIYGSIPDVRWNHDLQCYTRKIVESRPRCKPLRQFSRFCADAQTLFFLYGSCEPTEPTPITQYVRRARVIPHIPSV